MTDKPNAGAGGQRRGNSGGRPYGGDRPYGKGGKPGYSKSGRGGFSRGGYKGSERGGADWRARREGDGRRAEAGRGDAPRSWKGQAGRDGGGKSAYGEGRSGDSRGKRGGEGFRRNGEAGAKGGFDKKRFDSRGGKPRFDGSRRDGDAPRFDKPRRDGEGRGDSKGARWAKDGQRTDYDGKPRGPRRDFDDRAQNGAARFGAKDTARGRHDGYKKREAAGEHRRAGEVKPRRDFESRGNRGDGRGGHPARDNRLSPARSAALAIGREVRKRDAFVAEVTPGILATFEGISPEDSAFATKIARGVTATLGTLDEFIDRNLRSPDDIEADVRDALRVSAYELLFLGKADYAAVDQGVELVCSVAPKAGGLANAVLRKMAKSAKAFPFGRANLSLQVLARSQAFPLWLAKRLMNEMGLEKATAFMRACNADAPVHIAVNAIKAKDEDVIEVFDQAGSLLAPVEDVPGCYLVENARALAKPEVRALFEQGCVCVSDASAQAVALLACPEHDIEAYLEIGSGRGTKTVLLQNDAVRAFGRTMPMVSVDDHGFKAEILAKRCAAFGIESVRPVKADARKISSMLPEESFDAVLLDAPCSGIGTLRRHPEIRWRLAERDIEEMAGVELDMLIEAAKMVKQGGVLVYSTCTVFEDENERVVDRFLRTKKGEEFSIEKTLKPALTSGGPDAHFAVRLRRA